MTKITPTVCINVRIRADLYQKIKHAAELQGKSTTDFVINTIRNAAEQHIDETEVINLSTTDQKLFSHSLLDPPEPNDPLKRAIANRNQLLRSS